MSNNGENRFFQVFCAGNSRFNLKAPLSFGGDCKLKVDSRNLSIEKHGSGFLKGSSLLSLFRL